MAISPDPVGRAAAAAAAISAQPAVISAQPAGHGFHPLRIQAVVRETDEAATLVLDPGAGDEPGPASRYQAGQFLTFRVWIDGQPHLRSYSMSSSPAVDPDLRVTVKRVPGGLVSNWLLDTVSAGDVLEATGPAGVFCLRPDRPDRRDVVGFGAGSGITPVFSIVKAALATTERRVRLLCANRDPDAVIFGDELTALAGRWPDRLRVVHRYDAEHGFVDAETVSRFCDGVADADYYVCGPGPFMDVVEGALRGAGVDADAIHIERFTPAEAPPPPPGPGEATAARVTIELAGRVASVEHRPGTTILQTARQLGLAPPFSCEAGNCATCMAKLVEGSVVMHANNALTDEEVEEGWVLTCQAVPTSSAVRIVYDPEEA
jgi:ferredoxin-NADP reductase